MVERKKMSRYVTIGSLSLVLIVIALLVWFLTSIFEGEKPFLRVDPLPQFLTEKKTFAVAAMDSKRGLRVLKVVLNQEGREIPVLEKKFDFKGLLNRGGVRSYDTMFSVDPAKLNLTQGRVDLEVRVWDYSRRSGGDGNLTLMQHTMVIDTIPPSIRAVSRINNMNVGGAGLVVYQASSDTVKSGLFVDGLFYRGFPAKKNSENRHYVCYFAIPHSMKGNPELYLWAEDKAGNRSKTTFYYHIRRVRFRTERMNLTDQFVKSVLAEFSSYPFDPAAKDIDKFLKVNRELRKENHLTFKKVAEDTAPEKLWDGPWLRQKNSLTTGHFAEKRLYYYNGQKIDEQVHTGIDLASVPNAEVHAAASGRVIFAGRLGIYGRTLILDHGQGLASLYAHLSSSSVQVGAQVAKGEAIGATGQSGLAGGDHLHFGIMVQGMFVNPIEWWDPHWIRDNITRKLNLLDK